MLWWKYVLCERCFEGEVGRNVPLEMKNLQVERLPNELIDALKREKTLENEEIEGINEWIFATLQRISRLFYICNSLLTRSNPPDIGEFQERGETWDCLRCRRKVEVREKQCTCGYRELGLCQGDKVVGIYWKCAGCEFGLNPVSHSACLRCKLSNPDLLPSPVPTPYARYSQLLYSYFK